MWERVKQVVGDVLDLPASERGDALREACGEDEALLAEATSLLRSFEDAGDFLDQPAVSTDSSGDLTGRTLGAYKVQELIAHGGMGSVYAAVHERTNQTVALKVLRLTFGPGDWQRRFEHEVQILGQLQHPAIAQIHDAGTLDDGTGGELPFFAMEYVDGAALTHYAHENGLDVRGRIELIIKICEGVHHAHQRGVIHRDLKPDNILVTRTGHPKILDFGVARVSDSDGQALTQVTQAGQIIGTISYMSPEQVAGDPSRIDTRADVYALGVILFELLAGRRPHNVAGLPLPQAIRTIQEDEPLRLSSVDSSLRGDLDTIVQVALEPEPQRRYPSASEFAADLRRFLDDEPIAARPATTIYQLKKFARRHRGLVAGAALAFLALAIGLVTTLVYMFEARDQEQAAKTATGQAKEEAGRARKAEGEARTFANQAKEEAKKARLAEAEAKDFAQFLEDMFDSAALEVAGKNMTVVEMLDVNAPKIGAAFPDKPHLRARLFGAIGWDYFTLGEYTKAENYQRQALALRAQVAGNDATETISEANRYNNTLVYLDRLQEADTRTRQTLAQAKRVLGGRHLETFFAMQHRASVLRAQKKLEEAEQAYRDLLKLRIEITSDTDRLALGITNDLANVLQDLGRPAEAAPLYERIQSIYQSRFGPKHSRTLNIRISWALALAASGHPKRAATMLRDIIAVGEKIWGPNSQKFWDAKHNYASALQRLGHYKEAVEINRDGYEFEKRRKGPKHVDTLIALNNLCVNLMNVKDYDKAAERARELVDLARETRGMDHATTGQALNTYANALAGVADSQTDPERKKSRLLAKQKMEEALAITAKNLGETHPTTIIQRNNYGHLLQQMELLDDAIETMQMVLEDWTAHQPQAKAVRRVFTMNLARAQHAKKNYAAAERGFQAALALPEHPAAKTKRIFEFLVELYEQWNKPARLAAAKKKLAATK